MGSSKAADAGLQEWTAGRTGSATTYGEGFTSLHVLEGGVDAWRAAGKPLVSIERRPWSMERQVRTTAGSLVLLTLALGCFVSRYFLLGTAFVGAGLVLAGVSDTCMMASLLA